MSSSVCSQHLIVSVSVFRWCKCCASHNNMFYVFCPVAHSAVTISWLHMMFLWWQRVLSAWPWPAIIKVPISPIRPELCNIIIIVIICNGLRNSPSLRISQSSWFTLAISRLPHVIAEHKNFLRLHAYIDTSNLVFRDADTFREPVAIVKEILG